MAPGFGGSRRQELLERFLPLLVRLQARLDEVPALDELAASARLSPYHFHRLFRELTGETPKRYNLRLRLERAAYCLRVYRCSVLDVALDCGFQHHETFSRAFRRHFGITPRQYRAGGGARPAVDGAGDATGQISLDEPRLGVEELQPRYELSTTRTRELADLPVAFIRHVGPYDEVPGELWERLLAWRREQSWGRGIGPPTLLGIALDAPTITPPDRQRFDAAILVPGPVEPCGEIGFQVVPGGLYGETTFVGPYRQLYAAYKMTFARLLGMRRYRVIGLPTIEIYRASRIHTDYELNQTALYVPLEERRAL